MLNNLIGRLKSKDIITTLVNYGIRFLFKFALIIIIPLFTDGVVRGYWYTFGSIAALSTFADLGFTTIITQFAAHESVSLNINYKKRIFENNDEEINNISSLFRFALRWSGFTTITASVIIFFIGSLLFEAKNDGVNWLIPWVIYSLISGLNFVAYIVLAFFEGCGFIAISQKIKFIDAINTNVLTIVLLLLRWNLYALGIPLAITFMVMVIQINIYYGKFISQMIRCKINSLKKWFKPVLSLLWKYAISWGAGYIIFQIYTPLTFAVFGAEVSGKVGYTMTIVSALVTISNIWSYVSVPKLNRYAALRNWKAMDKEYNQNLLYIEGTFGLGIMVLFIAMLIPALNIFISNYILSRLSLAIFALGYLAQLYTSYTGVYLRAHKEEPLMILSVVTACCSLLLTSVFIAFLGQEFIFLGFTVAVTMTTPWVWTIAKKRKKALHN